ncbi:lysine--tRNA ligase [Liberibacter crescens]|uniref:lysine--tRNA ligase n=1 Tax=Liberibacter crescens TaxID=1273132 RepID=UPI000763042F|nr:lysine--tRNA ligase [Liberibacter crescens]AMC12746.1 lysine--tRNA ligase [Liberibacter crescens]
MSQDSCSVSLSSDVTEVREQKLNLLKNLIKEVYPAHFHRTFTNAQLIEKYNYLQPEEQSTDIVISAGRIHSSRNSGMFMDIHDSSHKIQVFTHKNITLQSSQELLPMIDLGDIIGVKGYMRRTKRGELTINAEEITILVKSLRPMPEKYHGLSDIELRYRKRYLDIISNEESKLRFQQRSHIISSIRQMMQEEEFMEVETPMLQPIYGGATADPFKTHHNILKTDMYLRIAPELYLKRLLISGLTDKIFELNRNFRNEGISTRHNPEFTMMEAYWAYTDYHDMMCLVEKIFSTLAINMYKNTEFAFDEKIISFKAPFPRKPMPDLVKNATGIDFRCLKNSSEAQCAAKDAGFEVEKDAKWGEILIFLFEELVEKNLIQPTHVTHFPKDVSPFAKELPEDNRFVERFETYCNGWEICNAFSELNDPKEQRIRMTEQLIQAHQRGEKEKILDEDFLEAMEHGMPPASGLGLGIDRLVMLLTNAPSIRDVILFPAQRIKIT